MLAAVYSLFSNKNLTAKCGEDINAKENARYGEDRDFRKRFLSCVITGNKINADTLNTSLGVRRGHYRE